MPFLNLESLGSPVSRLCTGSPLGKSLEALGYEHVDMEYLLPDFWFSRLFTYSASVSQAERTTLP